jgi:putative ATPase
MRNLLDLLADRVRKTPLAEQLRPKSLDDFIGQNTVLGEGMPLRNLILSKGLTSLILWGPPGVGKTTLARLIAESSAAEFLELSAVSSGIAELRKAVEAAQNALKISQKQTVLFIDEIHRYNKTQQDALLPYVENGTMVLIGSTTENPSFQVISALLSRVLVIRLDYLQKNDIQKLLERGVEQLGNLNIAPEALDFIVQYANGDARSALNLLETAYLCSPLDGESRSVTVTFLEHLAQQGKLNYDRDGDEHYDHASAYQKSMRGSDANAAMYWLGKMIAAGEDPRFIARRLVVTASEDVGNADPMALVLAMAAAQAVEKLGFPEGRIPLAQATIYVAKAKKSNQTVTAIDHVLRDIRQKGKSFPVPPHLRDAHYQDASKYGHGVGYAYSHDHPDTPQSFLPEALGNACYVEEEPS